MADKCQKCIHLAVCGKYEYDEDRKNCIDFADESKYIDFAKYIGKKVYVRTDTWSAAWYLANTYYNGQIYIVGEIVAVMRTKRQTLIKIRSATKNEHQGMRYKRYPISAIGKTVFLERSDKK
ncbi:MAG: hypothetical protein IJV87_06295 [Clostridia bacterium]|nr:hypothetical protein [Clostridia bacterium]